VSTPVVTEIVPRPEPVAHDPFIDDLRARASQALKEAAAGG
jgi:hypothetical protein